jgi:hypothetical protein
MGNVLAALALLGALIGVVTWARRRHQAPERRLLRDLQRLRRLILRDMDAAARPGAERALQGAEQHLRALLKARQQHLLLGQMAQAAAQMTGHAMTEGAAQARDFDAEVARQLAAFFSALARISTVVGLQRDEALGELESFSQDLSAQRDALVALTRELAELPAPAEAHSRR